MDKAIIDENILEKCIKEYVENDTDTHRYYSWHLCYQKFQESFQEKELTDSKKEELALMLGYYLLSWGMGRNSLLMSKYNYRVHKEAIDILFKYKDLGWWNLSNIFDTEKIIELKNKLKKHYVNDSEISPYSPDTLLSKVILGTLGCVPAYDTYFREGVSSYNKKLSRFNKDSLNQLWDFYQENRAKLETMNETRPNNEKYPPMKLIDILFWTIGYKSS